MTEWKGMWSCDYCGLAGSRVHGASSVDDHVLSRLLELSTETEQQLLAAVQHLSGEEFLQVAEERALAGMCGSAACANLLSAPKPKGTFKIDTRQQRIYRDGDIMFCRCASPVEFLACTLATRMLWRVGSVSFNCC